MREVSFGVRVPNVFSVHWQFSRQDVRGLAYKCGPSGEVRVPAFFRLKGSRDSTLPNMIVSESAPGSMHIHQGVSRPPTSEDITKAHSGGTPAKIAKIAKTRWR